MLRRLLAKFRHYLTYDPMAGYGRIVELRRQGAIIGENCYIDPSAVITDPYMLVLGDNVRISSGVHIFGHDGSVNMINRAYGMTLDKVVPVRIGSDVFIGHGSIICPGATIGNRVVIGAGSVVRGHLNAYQVYAGNPAVPIAETNTYVNKLIKHQRGFSDSWKELLYERGRDFDPAFEPALMDARRAHYHLPPLSNPTNPA